MGKEKFIKNALEKGDEVCAFERPQVTNFPSGGDELFLLEVKIQQKQRSYLMWSAVNTIAYSKLMIFDKKMTVRDIKRRIFNVFRPIIKVPADVTNKIAQKY
jgi:hypothetical protein